MDGTGRGQRRDGRADNPDNPSDQGRTRGAHRDSAVCTQTNNLIVSIGAILGGGGTVGAMVDWEVIGTIDKQADAKRKAA